MLDGTLWFTNTGQPDRTTLRWLGWIFHGEYLTSLIVNCVGMSKDMGRRLPQLYNINMKIYDLSFFFAMATKTRQQSKHSCWILHSPWRGPLLRLGSKCYYGWDFYYAWVQMLLQMGPLLHLGPIITLVPSPSLVIKRCVFLTLKILIHTFLSYFINLHPSVTVPLSLLSYVLHP